mmetsp:Transcript_5892/g.18601  ORF Transcript_5892/g.18601 Transcript_5892/m.18601 type:complete len:375 (-) Transcript_5892:22-1146(-)
MLDFIPDVEPAPGRVRALGVEPLRLRAQGRRQDLRPDDAAPVHAQTAERGDAARARGRPRPRPGVGGLLAEELQLPRGPARAARLLRRGARVPQGAPRRREPRGLRRVGLRAGAFDGRPLVRVRRRPVRAAGRVRDGTDAQRHDVRPPRGRDGALPSAGGRGGFEGGRQGDDGARGVARAGPRGRVQPRRARLRALRLLDERAVLRVVHDGARHARARVLVRVVRDEYRVEELRVVGQKRPGGLQAPARRADALRGRGGAPGTAAVRAVRRAAAPRHQRPRVLRPKRPFVDAGQVRLRLHDGELRLAERRGDAARESRAVAVRVVGRRPAGVVVFVAPRRLAPVTRRLGRARANRTRLAARRPSFSLFARKDLN